MNPAARQGRATEKCTATGESVLVTEDSAKRFGAMEKANAMKALGGLLKLYWSGLGAPLRFFPQSSWAFVEAARKAEAKGKNPAEAIGKARTAWFGNSYNDIPGEGDDAYFNLFFGAGDPLDNEFARLAGEVFGPLLAQAMEVES